MIFQYTILAALATIALAKPTPTRTTNSLQNRDLCNDHENQLATWYDKGTDPNQITACGHKYDPTAIVVAISTDVPNYKQYCGRQILISSREQTAAVIAVIDDANATGTLGEFALDLSPAVFDILSPTDLTVDADGEVAIDWVVLGGDPCP
ncbi:uncharacterized protein TRIREDRAFT_110117 [Trichoderma reesei QM6a]|jgi:hypothetical protein|uniref:Predicted protein n=2 Tax=Hypocrea jecorina TaxID=51453 RepID=G0RR89_HYPJQ|nr:uncharacterized protein TRIREDRAFT_110117 [Trichoderma reesei QM6a]EGR46210.1 predicted protein [Trichoderma reesei QM6a]ETR99206.1 hypothetical protein M419DRAFT_37676 [Trichoderma reesei RUT C-30]